MTEDIAGDVLVTMLSALANPQRLRIVAALTAGRQYVSELARTVRLSRPLVHAHLARLSAAGLVTSALEVSPDGKATRYVEVEPFVLHLTPDRVARAAETLNAPGRRREVEGD
ncbi:ArsR/SmtB family transcription factor [Actinoplanes siamensis]|uniref:Transcriptional regulator n=1 Tax=Actinoplanes siamensis TaxID=1223317 RepID=A0A919NA66_9ACTN|nr:ArsR family transcriptional regulator [Actinoplanes siamensis]GIF07065.1 transcriptional regulator [Actinoplanes siamensis]